MPVETKKQNFSLGLGDQSPDINRTSEPGHVQLPPPWPAAAGTNDKAMNSVAFPSTRSLLGEPQQPPTPPFFLIHISFRGRTGYGFDNRRGPCLRPSCKIHKRPDPHRLTDIRAQHPVWQQENPQGVEGREREVKPINSCWNH